MAERLKLPPPELREWAKIEAAFAKAVRYANKVPTERFFTPYEFIDLITIVYNYFQGADPIDTCRILYAGYQALFEVHLSLEVIPYLQKMNTNEDFLNELVEAWRIYKEINKLVYKFFRHAENVYCEGPGPREMQIGPSLKAICYSSFYKLVYGDMKERVRNTVMSMI